MEHESSENLMKLFPAFFSSPTNTQPAHLFVTTIFVRSLVCISRPLSSQQLVAASRLLSFILFIRSRPHLLPFISSFFSSLRTFFSIQLTIEYISNPLFFHISSTHTSHPFVLFFTSSHTQRRYHQQW